MTKIRSITKLYKIYSGYFFYLLYEYLNHFVQPVVQLAAKCKRTFTNMYYFYEQFIVLSGYYYYY